MFLFCTSLFAQAKPIEVPFEFYKSELIAEVMIDGKGPFMMMLDTGTDPSAIDLATADAIGIKRSTKGVGASGGGTGKNLAFECKLNNVQLGRLKAGTIAAGAIDLSKISERIGKHIDGIIGYSLFKGRIVQFDYPKSVMRFYGSAPAHSAGATTLNFRYADNVLLDDVWVNGAKVVASLDTGSSGTVQLSPRGVERLGLADAAAKGEVRTSMGYNGSFENRVGKLASVKIGGLLTNNVDVLYFPPGSGHDKAPWDINIGNVFLKDYVVTVDYRAKTVTFER
ncbi:MAG TPA: pepsin/retropepsin-like aspartic protease family protein [Pyrinomonadaceae bacterium]